jgi:hypothetical protein
VALEGAGRPVVVRLHPGERRGTRTEADVPGVIGQRGRASRTHERAAQRRRASNRGLTLSLRRQPPVPRRRTIRQAALTGR